MPDKDSTLLHVICDYAPNGLEFAEIMSRIQFHLADPHQVTIQQLATPPLDTIAVGFVTYQLALAPVDGRMFIYGNAAPRRDQREAQENNVGSGLKYVRLKNGVEIMQVYSQYSLSFLKDEIVEFRDVASPAAGSQFRSRDYFPERVAKLINGDREILTDELNVSEIEEVPNNLVAWTDGFGNVKTTMRKSDLVKQGFKPGEKVQVILNGVSLVGVIADGGFTVERGVLAVNAGSSGYDDPFVELFLRVHHMTEKTAAMRFDYPAGGTPFEIRKLS